MLLETIFMVMENILYNQFVVDAVIAANGGQALFSLFSLGQSTVLINFTGILVIDSYIHKIACIVSIHTYVIK